MPTPTHIRAWAAVYNNGEIDLATICTRKSSTETYTRAFPNIYKNVATITIALGHELADKLEKEK